MKNSLVLLALLCLMGCANQAFDCPYKEGIRCVRLSEVDRRIDQGTLIKPTESPSLKIPPKTQEIPPAPEDTLSVWVAPYQSKEGILHEQQWVHFPVPKMDDFWQKETSLD